MPRRCVICGRENPHDEFGNPQYHYPKNRQEAKIWQESLQAKNVSVNALQNYSCVCYNHIPEFVDRTARTSCCQYNYDGVCPYEPEPPATDCHSKAPINVLLMTGASLPIYCGKSCTEEPPGPYNKLSDTDICVLESSFSDMGMTFPDDQPEISVMHCNEKKKEKEREKQMDNEQSDYDDINDYDVYLDDEEDKCSCTACTDVLVLARAKDEVCPCEGTTCANEDPGDSVCCPPGCMPHAVRQSDAPPCGCECEQAVREELDSVIKKQALRIRELEMMLNRQAQMHEQIYSKVDDLHKEVLMKPNPTDVFQPAKPSQSYTEAKYKLETNSIKNKNEEKMDRRAESLLFDTLVKPTSDKNLKDQSKQANQPSKVNEKDSNKNENKKKDGAGGRSSRGSIVSSGKRRESVGKVSIKEEDIKDKERDKIEIKPKPDPKRKERIPFCRKMKYLLKRKPKD